MVLLDEGDIIWPFLILQMWLARTIPGCIHIQEEFSFLAYKKVFAVF